MSPWNLHTALFAKHAQHVVLIHFPIALFLAAVVFDAAATWAAIPAGPSRWGFWSRHDLATVSFWNLTLAAASAIPAAITGLLAWQWELDGRRLKGILLLHLLSGTTSLLLITSVWFIHERARRRQNEPPAIRWPLELLAVAVVAFTGHLGGFLSGVNHP